MKNNLKIVVLRKNSIYYPYILKVGRCIKGFVLLNSDNTYSYVFGKPSDSSFLSFGEYNSIGEAVDALIYAYSQMRKQIEQIFY